MVLLCSSSTAVSSGIRCSSGRWPSRAPEAGAGRLQGGRVSQWKLVGSAAASSWKLGAAVADCEHGCDAVVKKQAGGVVGHQALWNGSSRGTLLAFFGSRFSRSVPRRDGDLAVPRAVVEDGESPSLVNEEGVEGVSNVEIAASPAGTSTEKSDSSGREDGWTLEPPLAFTQWDTATARLADSATAAFLLLQLPQIILNAQNLLTGNPTALFAVPWLGQLTGLLGNLSLLSYFASKKERGAMVVQAVGVVSTLVVLSQLAIADAMPRAAFTVTATVVVVGLALNFLNYNNKLSPELWRIWGEAVSIGGVTVLPQVMWSTFEPYIPHSTLPGTIFGILAVSFILLARLGKLPPNVKSIMGSVSAWTATLLFMWMPVAQWWQNYLYPANIRGLSVFTVLLAMIGNSLLLPRALFTRDLMWFTGSGWGTLLQGWGILVSMYLAQVISNFTFWGVSGILFLCLGTMLWKDSKAYNLSSPLAPLVELVSRKKIS